MQQMKIEDRLRAELVEHPQDVMVIVGAGVPLGALHGTEYQARASWGGLIRHGLDHTVGLGLYTEAEAEAVAGLLAHAQPDLWIAAAEQLSRVLRAPHGGDFKVWLREAVGPFAGAIQDRSVLDVLVDLQRRGATLATVNYDGMLEEVTGLRPVTWLDASEVERVLRRHAQGILHLHGYYERPESVVLGTSSYAQVVADRHARAVLESMRMFRTLVFIGHGAGLQDPNWQRFLDWTAEVFHGSTLYHYRIVLESDMETLRDPDQQDRRIFPVPYPGTYANLGPFLRSLVPTDPAPTRAPAPADASSSAPAVRRVLLLVNIRNSGDTPVSAEEVAKFADIHDIAETHVVRKTLDLGAARERHWREIAASLDGLLATAHRVALESPDPVTFVIAGRAPLPVFAYLGYHSKRLNGRVLIVNQHGERWDHIGPFSGAYDFPASTRTPFRLGEAPQFQRAPGKVGLFVGCSKRYSCSDDALVSIAAAGHQELSALHRIEGILDHERVPLRADDLAALSDLFSDVQAEISRRHPHASGLILAPAGPTWVAFWVGRLLNTNVTGLIDFPNRPPGKGHYVRALASRMDELPWVHGLPDVLALSAEPDKEARIRAGEGQDALVEAVEREQGMEARRRITTVGATKVSDLVRRLATTQPDILHVYAHGAADGSLGLQDESGASVRVSADALMSAIRATELLPSLAVVVACHSATLAPALLEVAELVVAVEETVPYKTAAQFIGAFYGALARGNSVALAFDQAKAHVDLQPRHDSTPFTLLSRDGVDSAKAVFWPSRG